MTEDMIPLRAHIEALLEQQTRHVDGRFNRVEQQLKHRHREYPTWKQFVMVLLTLGGVVVGIIQIG